MLINDIEDHTDLSEAAGALLTQNQAINMAYIILDKTGKFKDCIKEWNRKPVVDKTWHNFKEHITLAYEELLETEDLALEETQFVHQANMIQYVVAEAMKEVLDKHDTMTTYRADEETMEHPNAMAILTTQQQHILIPQLMEQVQAMQSIIV